MRIKLLLVACAGVLAAASVLVARHRNNAHVRVRALACLNPNPVVATTQPATNAPDASLWRLFEGGGQVVRHAATTPGTGDPPNFKLGDCSTQRNLSDDGRTQARAIGAELNSRGVEFGDVRSSQWCRCLDTARLMLGRVEEEPALNSIFEPSEKRDAQIEAMRKLAGRRPERGNTLLVTRQANITALTGEVPAMGEMVIITPDGKGGFRVAGRLRVVEQWNRLQGPNPLAATKPGP